MSDFSPNAVKMWFGQTLGINSTPSSGELQTHCPECGSDVFYFNYFKQVGVCHKATCGFTPTLWDLIELVGYAPDQTGFWEAPQAFEEVEGIVELPGWNVLTVLLGDLMTPHQPSLEYLRERGIPDEIILNWGITTDMERVYVPIKSGGEVRNYNSRLLPGHLGRKYLYKTGAKTGLYILGWEECELWARLSLIENTFVSLAFRRDLASTTVFGSNLSDTQADMIAKSKVKEVAVLWDEGVEKKAEKAVKKLHSRGVKAAYWIIKGQPDDHPPEEVKEWAMEVYQAAKDGVDYIDFRGK